MVRGVPWRISLLSIMKAAVEFDPIPNWVSMKNTRASVVPIPDGENGSAATKAHPKVIIAVNASDISIPRAEKTRDVLNMPRSQIIDVNA